MSGSILELIRSNHEDLENIEKAAASILLDRHNRVLSGSPDAYLKFLIDEISRKSLELERLYADADGAKIDEISQLGGTAGSDVWQSFYSKVKDVKEYHRKHAEKQLIPKVLDTKYWYQAAMEQGKLDGNFTGEECNGKYVDMSHLHMAFINLKKVRDFRVKDYLQQQWAKYVKKRQQKDEGVDVAEITESEKESFFQQKESEFKEIDYVSWLKSFDQLQSIPRHLKYRQFDYIEYVKSLIDYLCDFSKRQRPLFDIEKAINDSKLQFQINWDNKQIEGWNEFTCDMSSTYSLPTDRLFGNENSMKGHISGKDYAKAFQKFSSLSDDEKYELRRKSIEHDRSIAESEVVLLRLREILGETIEDTVDHVNRKQARSATEIDAELNEAATTNGHFRDNESSDGEVVSSEGEEVDMNDERGIYNPLNLPIGWDGKPIPYWLYKLHGLGEEFKCEICGNYSYWGRRAFEKHFSEWRHAHGMRCLRIPNTPHFEGITKIEDAVRLYEKIRKETIATHFNPEKDTECEDPLGNVMSYKAYQDLVRQGLI